MKLDVDDVSENYSNASLPKDEDATINLGTYAINEEGDKPGRCKN